MACEIADDVVVTGGGFCDLLRIFCGKGAWDYAVFWKIRHQTPPFLSWEDGYCHHIRPEVMPKYALDAAYFDGGADISSSIEDTDRQLERFVAGMSSLCFFVGEGLVGEVARTGNYCWLSCDDVLNYINSETPSVFMQVWLPQFSVGIKTILLVPVLPHGVLQLGSVEMVTKDMEVVAHIAERFVSLHNVLGHSQIYLEPEDVQDLLLHPPMSCLTEDVDDSSSIIEKKLACAIDLTEDMLNFKELTATLEPLEENLFVLADDDLDNSLFSSAEACAFMEFYSGGLHETAAADCPSSDLIALAYADKVLNDIQEDILGNVFSFSMDCDFEEVLIKDDIECPAFTEADVGNSTSNNNESAIEVGNHDSLTSLVETTFISQKRKYRSEESSSTEGDDSVSDLIALAYADKGINDIQENIMENVFNFSMDWDFEELFLKDDIECPASTASDVGDSTSNTNESPIEVANHDSSTSLVETTFISQKKKYRFEESSPTEGEDSVEHSVITTAFSTKPQDSPHDSSISSSTSQSVLNLADEKDQTAKVGIDKADQEQKRATTGCKRKGRPVDNPRPRPRDRQLIQDRVKELRDLIPNGSKCSIDALLEQTVKHMQFLRSVTSRAEKLRKYTPSEENGWNRWSDLEIASERQNVSNGALDIGGDLQICPIVVQDLEYPGLMLIEMMCYEHGLFLEIAEVLRRLELNIISGSTEARRDNIWASFVVEASKGFHRVDIFWPLMQLLQRTRKNTSSLS